MPRAYQAALIPLDTVGDERLGVDRAMVDRHDIGFRSARSRKT
jgi:hypothetical protein